MLWNYLGYFLQYPIKKLFFKHPLCNITPEKLHEEYEKNNVELMYFSEGAAYIQTGDMQTGKLKKGICLGLIKYFWLTAYEINSFEETYPNKKVWEKIDRGYGPSLYTIMRGNRKSNLVSCDDEKFS